MSTSRLESALDINNQELVTQDEVIVPVADGPQISKWYRRIGKGIALIFGIGTGVTAAAAFMSAGTFIVTAIILSSFSAYANYCMSNGDLIRVLVEGPDELFKKAKTDKEAEDGDESPYISKKKQFLLKIGIFLSVTFGATMAALTYVAALKLAVYPVLAPVVFLLSPFGIVLATVTLIIQTVLMSVGFADIIKIDNIWEKIKSTCNDMFGPNEVRDRGKSRTQIVAERTLKVLTAGGLLLSTIALVMLGISNTLATCAAGFKDILMGIPNASPQLVAGVSFVITQVFSLVAQIPFVLKVTSRPIVWLFTPSEPVNAELAEKKPLDVLKILDTAFLFLACFLNSACMSAIAMEGKASDTFTMIGGFGAFLNGFIASTVNALISGGKEKPGAQKTVSPNPNSTLAIHGQLKTTPTVGLVVNNEIKKEDGLQREQNGAEVDLSVTNEQPEAEKGRRPAFG